MRRSEPFKSFACREIMALRRIVLSVAASVMVAGCSTGPTAAIRSTTCAEWRSMSETAQTELVTAMVDEHNLLEAVRAVQHAGPAVSRAALLQDVVGSITKNCQALGGPDPRVLDIALQLYGSGRASDGYVGASGAPTPERETSPSTP
nr:HdeA/HdeB family [uncultured bacterium]